MSRILLIFPPCAKPCEPPAGIAVLHGTLAENGISSSILDANLESLACLLDLPLHAGSRRTAAALRNRGTNVLALKNGSAFGSIDHYSRIVWELNHAVRCSGGASRPGLADYSDASLSPVLSRDLLRQAEEPGRCAHDRYYRENLLSRIEAEAPQWIGISITYLSQAMPAFALIGRIRSRFPDMKIAIGGGLVASWMRLKDWKDPFSGLVDLCVAGPGEEALLSLFGGKKAHPQVRLPDYSDMPAAGYWSPAGVLPIAASTGCWWKKCVFCPENAENAPYRSMPVERITDCLKGENVQGTGLIHFLDNALPPALVKALIEQPPAAPLYGYIRMTGEWTDPEYCFSARRSGCVMLKLGLESGDQHVLDRMEKGIRLEDAALVLRNLKKAGIATYVYLLFGTPWEDAEKAAHTMDFILRHSGHIDFINAAIFNLPRFSTTAEALKTKPFYDGDLSLYADFEHPRGWKRAFVRRFLSREFGRNPAIRNILKNTPPHFTSNHAPFFLDSMKPAAARTAVRPTAS